VDNIRAVISPHAGYIFSGQVAATAYLPLKNRTDIKRIFLIGSSHHAWFEGASVYYDAHYITPLGKIEIETEIARKLLAHGEIISYHPEAHANEHSLEVQLPFLQYILSRKFTIIPIIIGSQSKDTPYRLADILKEYFVPGNLFVISTDLSHYPEYYDAVKTDQLTIEALCSNNPEIFNRQVAENEKKRIPNLSTSICGWSSALTLLSITSSLKGVAYHPVLYQNSGDIALYGEKTRVVGYQSVLITVAQDEEDYSGSLSAEKETTAKTCTGEYRRLFK
jgi:AmmeMemoRadiSam system protein B